MCTFSPCPPDLLFDFTLALIHPAFISGWVLSLWWQARARKQDPAGGTLLAHSRAGLLAASVATSVPALWWMASALWPLIRGPAQPGDLDWFLFAVFAVLHSAVPLAAAWGRWRMPKWDSEAEGSPRGGWLFVHGVWLILMWMNGRELAHYLGEGVVLLQLAAVCVAGVVGWALLPSRFTPKRGADAKG